MIVGYRKNSKMMMYFSTALLFIIGIIFFSFAGFAKVNHVQSVSDFSNLQAHPFEVQTDLAIRDNYIKYEKETMRFVERIQEAAISQDIGVNQKIDQGKLGRNTQKVPVDVKDAKIKYEQEAVRHKERTQKASIVTQNKTVRDRVVPEAEDREDKKDLIEIQNKKIKDDIKALKLAGDNKKTPAQVLNIFSEAYNTYPENIDILKYYQFAAHESQQYVEAARPSEKISNTGEVKRMKYLDLTDSGNYIAEKLNNAEGTADLPENDLDGEKIYNLKGVDEYPKIIRVYTPRYPFEAKAKGIEGRVLLRFIVDRTGNVQDPKVVSAEPEGFFEQAALEAVIKYRIKPAIKDGKGVSSVVKLPINFTIHDNYLRLAQR